MLLGHRVEFWQGNPGPERSYIASDALRMKARRPSDDTDDTKGFFSSLKRFKRNKCVLSSVSSETPEALGMRRRG